MRSSAFIPNVALKVAIVTSGQKQHEIARAANISETVFSHIVRGRHTPDKTEREAIAVALKKPIDELFPGAEAVA